MRTFTKRLKYRFFRSGDHPYRIFERKIGRYLHPDHTLLDAGCGRGAVLLIKLLGQAKRLIGVDLVDFEEGIMDMDTGIELLNNDLAHIKLEDRSVDLVISQSVMEHLREPRSVYSEIHRILKHGGHFIFLTPNLGDYASLVSKLIPNKFHPWIVAKAQGRKEEDTFPTYYRSNTYRAINRLAKESGFELINFRYLGQYPAYFDFNPVLFLIATAYEKLITWFNSLRYLRGWLLVVLRKKSLKSHHYDTRICQNTNLHLFQLRSGIISKLLPIPISVASSFHFAIFCIRKESPI